MRSTMAWRADETATMRRARVQRRNLRADDLAVRVDYCGVCHTDLHAIGAGAHEGETPLVPGHEFTGVVSDVGADVTDFSIGDPVAVGNIVDSCGVCDLCASGHENFCREFPTLTYGGTDRRDGSTTLGGYSREYVVRDRFAYRLPAGLDPAGAAPLLCAGITVWEPLRSLGVSEGSRVAVVGLGGLGHLAVKLAVALGAETTVISRSADKVDDAHRLGARTVVLSTDA
ncbi:MAG: alcohol dehydrogenase catalytic domain-containing protein, partial [Actinomycetia bacterium]|nr:alcohol dehydrogenase catalytic domain-containing protein [Actinomycetes bacterium]